MDLLERFRGETRDWLEVNCPASMRTRMVPGEEVNGGRKRRSTNPDSYLWLERMAQRGWTVPNWPKSRSAVSICSEPPMMTAVSWRLKRMLMSSRTTVLPKRLLIWSKTTWSLGSSQGGASASRFFR